MLPHVALCALLILQGPRVPFEPGLDMTWAASITGEPDWETRLTLMKADSQSATVRISWNRSSNPSKARWLSDDREVLNSDRRSARSGNSFSMEKDTTDYPGSPFSMASTAVLNELKSQGWVAIELLIPEASPFPYTGVVERVGTTPEKFPVLINGRRVFLPGIRAKGNLENSAAPDPMILVNFLYLDDPKAAWWLEVDARRPNGRGGHQQLIRISYPSESWGLEQQLAKQCRANVYDLYFATASADLDSASSPVLGAITRAMKDHPDWNLTIIGHTDSIGGTDYNLDLSTRRAERTRSALVEEYHVAAARLRAEGRGESQPVEDNGTMAGRARNRRVELLRECGSQ
jgi:outer membrane protein OmpA-like peptidoglycan-associated protein